MPTLPKTTPSLALAGAILLAVFTTGCTNLKYGWKQEKQIMDGVSHSIESSLKFTNEASHPHNPWLYGIKKERHQAPSFADWQRGYREDVRIWLAK